MSTNNSQMPIILASSSPYRKELLQRLHLNFTCISPDIDESRKPDETPNQLALRLAKNKAQIIAKNHPQSIIIGSDQVCAYKDTVLGKPGNHENAASQLQMFSNQSIQLHSAVCVIHTEHVQIASVTGTVFFKQLDHQSIERYLLKEKPYDCAGSCKLEGLGITLIKSIECEDPTALMGMPLMELITMLIKAGITLP